MNRGSRFAWFTIALLLVSLPGLASADRVLLMPLGGRADQERLEELEGLLSDILTDQGHRIVPPGDTPIGQPPSSAEMDAAASAANAGYVVFGEVEPMPGQYRFHVYVYYVANGRVEELVVTVLSAEERERLGDVMSSMVRREGLGEDAIRLTGESSQEDPPQSVVDPEEEARRQAEEAAAREAEEARQRELEAAARQEEEERARREAEEEAERERSASEAWNNRSQYGADAPWLIQLGLGGRYGVLLGDLPPGLQGGGGLFDVALRLGRTFEGIDGFEIRARVDFSTGIYTGLGVHLGAAWLGSFFVEPVYIGLGGEVGAVFTFTGSRDVGFSGQISALFAWQPVEHLYFEASLPELGIISPGSGAFTIGASVRGGYRF